jgi:hypothetical protein
MGNSVGADCITQSVIEWLEVGMNSVLVALVGFLGPLSCRPEIFGK